MPNTDNFYDDLIGFKEFSHFTHLKHYQSLPSDWFVVITDIEGSTKAIQDGCYKDVNSLGAASIVALLNAVSPLKVPFVFGGDGSTICIPHSYKNAVESALVATQLMAHNEFNLHLRIGMVPSNIIEEEKRQVLVGKYQPSPHFQQAMFQGDGLGFAESLVKDSREENPYLICAEDIEAKGSFEGFECRWNEIPSPKEETVSILVQAIDQESFSKESIYNEVTQKIHEIYGEEEEHHPLKEEKLSLNSSRAKLSAEIKIRTAFKSSWDRFKYGLNLKLLVNLGKFLMYKKIKTKDVDWGDYKKSLIVNTDYRKFDEVLRMILSGSKKQRSDLTNYLEGLNRDKKIVFGIHASSSALITCLINNYDKDHIHFLDGSDGGYAMAAKDMKQQLKEI